MSQMKQIAIYGAGGFGRHVAWLVTACNETGGSFEVACFVDDDVSVQGQTVNGIPVMSLPEALKAHPRVRVVGAIGEPKDRQRLMQKAAGAGLGFETIVHPSVQHSPWLELGEGSVVCAGSIFSANAVVGRHVQINMGCTIGHDVILRDYATLSPGVHVSGHVHVGERAVIGTGAVTVHGTAEEPLLIGNDAVIGAGACVTKSVPAGMTVVGVPAQPLRTS
jgi:sugar O-acyltransferase (sialic acid O-acetyltransferase NeuD family)